MEPTTVGPQIAPQAPHPTPQSAPLQTPQTHQFGKPTGAFIGAAWAALALAVAV